MEDLSETNNFGGSLTNIENQPTRGVDNNGNKDLSLPSSLTPVHTKPKVFTFIFSKLYIEPRRAWINMIALKQWSN